MTVWWNSDNAIVFTAWDTTLKEIWLLYNGLYTVAPPWKRRTLETKWKEYKGIDTEAMQQLKGELFDSKRPPKDRHDFLAKITNILNAVGVR